MHNHTILLTPFFLFACTPVVIPTDDAAMQSSSTISELSSSSEESSTSSIATISLEEALDQTFTSQKLGISFKYPSTMYDTDCDKEMSVEVQEKEFSIDLVPTTVFDGDCLEIVDAVEKQSRQHDFSATIYAQRVTTDVDLRQFIDRVFSPDCIISEQSEYEGLTQLFLQSKTPTDIEASFNCGESLMWNKSAGVILFSSLGSKTGGGIEWYGKRSILSSDGTYGDPSRDFLIMDSIQYLPR